MEVERETEMLVGSRFTRREILSGALTGGVFVGAGALESGARAAPEASAVTPRRGGSLRVGAAGGGANDTLDPHQFVTHASIARMWQLYEPLLVYNSAYKLESALAEEISGNSTA